MRIHVDDAQFREALAYLKKGDAVSAHNALLHCCNAYDRSLLQQFRDKNCNISAEEIESFSELECWSLSHAISRQMYWDEPPLFSVNNRLVDIPNTPFRFVEQINDLVRRLETLLNAGGAD